MRISKRQLTQRVLLGLLCTVGGTYGTVSAMPTSAHDLQNISSVTQSGSVMDVVGKGNSVAKWNDFSIGKGETVNFKGMNNVLNLVDGNRFSTIRGAMNGKGVNVYLVNPSGVMFGAESSVNVGSLHVSTQNATDDLAKAFVKDGTIAPDTSKLGFGDVTMVGNISADTIQIEGNNISLANTKALDAKNVALSTPKGGFINVLKGQDVSKLKVDNGTIRNDFEAIDSQDKLANLKNGGHYMLTKDIAVDGTWAGVKDGKSGIVFDGMGHAIQGMNGVGLFAPSTEAKNIELCNLVLSGKDFTRSQKGGSSLLFDNVNGLKADNIVNDYKSMDSGMSNYIYNGELSNIVNNASVTGSSTGNVTNYGYNTNFTNIINNGNGYAGVAYTINGGNLKNSVNTGTMKGGGLVGYYYGPQYSPDMKETTVQILHNTNYGDSASDSAYSYGGIVMYANFMGDKTKLLADGNVNRGKAFGSSMPSGGIFGSLYFSGAAGATLSNNTNYGDVSNPTASGGIIGYINGGLSDSGELKLTNNTNYGKIHSPYRAGGIIGEIGGLSGVRISLQNITNYGDIDADGSTGAGGIIGWDGPSSADLQMNNVRNFGNIQGKANIGGILGFINTPSSFSFKNVYNTGTVTSSGGGWGVGGIIGTALGAKYRISNAYNTGDIISGDGKSTLVGGIVGRLDNEGHFQGSEQKASTLDGIFENIFNTGNIKNAQYSSGGFVGALSGTGSILIKNAYTTGNVSFAKQDPDYSFMDTNKMHGEMVGAFENWKQSASDEDILSVSIENAYSIGSVINSETGEVMHPIIGFNDNPSPISLKNVYTKDVSKPYLFFRDPTVFKIENEKAIGDEKKASSFSGFDIDTDGSRKDATWRMYEGYTAPMLSVFMNSVDISDPNKTVEYNGKMQFFPLDEVEAKNPDFAKRNFFTDYIDYAKNNPVYDKATGKPFEAVSGTEVGTYPAALYSTQLGYNFHTAVNDDTVTLTIVPRKEPVIPTVPVVPSTVYNPVKLTLTHQTGSYKDLDGKNHDLLNGKEAARIEPVDNKDIIEIKN